MSAMGDYALWLTEAGRTDSEASRDAYVAQEHERLVERLRDLPGIKATRDQYFCQDPAHRTCGCPKWIGR
jgi:hypothetical protein